MLVPNFGVGCVYARLKSRCINAARSLYAPPVLISIMSHQRGHKSKRGDNGYRISNAAISYIAIS
nr:MAG TPA: hypothetical protein [Caudoviricetes sp.]